MSGNAARGGVAGHGRNPALELGEIGLGQSAQREKKAVRRQARVKGLQERALCAVRGQETGVLVPGACSAQSCAHPAIQTKQGCAMEAGLRDKRWV